MPKFVKSNSVFFMKSNQQFKNEALDALHGNWTKAVLITLIYVFIVGLFSGPVTYQSLEAQAYVKENVHNIRQMTTLIQDPAYQALQRRTNGTSAILTLAEILLIFPLAVGYANSIKKLVFEGDNNLLANMFHFSFGNYLHKVWGMLWMYILVALWSLLLIIPGFLTRTLQACFSSLTMVK